MRGELALLKDSENNTDRERYIDITFMVANGLILLITSVVGIAANIFVILAVYHQKSLQTSINALVVNLAVIDALRCVIDCPVLLTIVMTVYQRGHVDGLICDSQVASFSFCCCIQLLTLSCISAERHQAIAQPFKTTQRRRRITVLIPLTWTLAFVVAGFCLVFLKNSPVHVKCKGLQMETFSYDTFGIHMLFPLWVACFVIIIGFYTSIFALVKSHNRKIFDKGTFHPSKADKAEDKQEIGETTAVENGHKKPEQNQTLSKSAAQVELVTKAEPNSTKKDSTAALLHSTEAVECFSVVSRSSTESKTVLKITNLETDQPCPPALQMAVQGKEKPFETEQPGPSVRTVEANPSNGDTVPKAKCSTTKVQVSSDFATEKLYIEGAKINKAPSEKKESPPRVCTSSQLEKPETTSVFLIEPKRAQKNDGGGSLPVAAVDPGSSLHPVSNNIPETEGTKMNVEVEGAVCMMPSKARKERASKKKESKMAKRAGYIILTFLLFWLPLITTILVNFVVHKNKMPQIPIIQDMEILSVSLACITSLSNPIIYAAVNPQFFTEFCKFKKRVQTIFNKKL
ncbi:dopamine D2-like receptor [Antennarius striatus]|uniref:dopamine D2-like receptor n=1 Tax=Antennarius striatus TaxID=241820 RepID=UPI0035AD83B1